MTIRKSILIALNNVHPFLVPQLALFTDVKALNPQPLTWSEFRAGLEQLEASRLVVSLRDAEGGLKFKITDQGKAELLEP
jgi:hypothetical protein